MTEGLFFQLATLVVVIAANTAVFIWRLVSFRDDVIKRIDDNREAIENRITIAKAAIDLEIDSVRRDFGEFRVHVAREYLDKRSIDQRVEKLENIMTNGFEKLEARMIRLDERVPKMRHDQAGF